MAVKCPVCGAPLENGQCGYCGYVQETPERNEEIRQPGTDTAEMGYEPRPAVDSPQPNLFMREIFGTKGIVMTYDIVTYLSSMVTEIFSAVAGESSLSALDLAAGCRTLAAAMQLKLNEQTKRIGITFSDILIENISLPDPVEALIDEQSGISMAKNDMDAFVQYQTARAMRDAAKQEGAAG